MSEVSAQIQIDVAANELWAVLMDPDRLGDWVTIHRELAKVSDRPLRQGSTLEQTLCVRKVKFKVKWQVTELEPERLARWEGRGPARSRARTVYRLAASDGGVRFDYENEFRAPLGPLGAAASRALTGGVPQREASASLERLKSLLEQ